VVEPVIGSYEKDSVLDYLLGFDLLNNEEVLVPAQLALYKYLPTHPSTYAFPYSHTNGLASGNALEEAICHALCEVIERDAVSISDLCASSIPYSIIAKIEDSLKKLGNGQYHSLQVHDDEFVDDASIFPDVNISEIMEYEPVKFLVRRFAAAGIPLLIKNITQEDIGIPTFVASSIEWITGDYGYFAKGFGTHLDSRIALIRAIAELSQTRAANIQGARDDLRKIQYKENDEIYKRKWQFIPAKSSGAYQSKENNILFSEIKTYVKKDILQDIQFILDRLKNAGLKRAIIVELTHPDVGIPVVRAIVPGLETFEVAKLYTSTELIFGWRAKKYFKEVHGF
jgi:ribosomal protein S12 methylthiotransferase accessory factor